MLSVFLTGSAGAASRSSIPAGRIEAELTPSGGAAGEWGWVVGWERAGDREREKVRAVRAPGAETAGERGLSLVGVTVLHGWRTVSPWLEKGFSMVGETSLQGW